MPVVCARFGCWLRVCWLYVLVVCNDCFVLIVSALVLCAGCQGDGCELVCVYDDSMCWLCVLVVCAGGVLAVWSDHVFAGYVRADCVQVMYMLLICVRTVRTGLCVFFVWGGFFTFCL